jgi:hypothetical protein
MTNSLENIFNNNDNSVDKKSRNMIQQKFATESGKPHFQSITN